MTKNNKMMTALMSAGAALALSMGGAQAAHLTTYLVDFEELNDSGVDGNGTLVYNSEDGTLEVSLDFTGLAAGPHPMHIHGLFEEGVAVPGGTPADSVTPPQSADTTGEGDGDGFVETLEGVPFYGDILLQLVTEPGNGTAFLTAGEDGTASYDVTFDLSDSSIFLPSLPTGNVYSAEDLFPLILREIVIHGLVLADGTGDGTMFEVDGNCGDDFGDTPVEGGCYVALLPVAAAEISPVPLPGAAAFFLTAGIAGGAFRFSRKKSAA
ncbi:hypothetical protein [Parvularcula oceani]|uniref:hypothetical protein n=1 Tax=Parvularcula oceani TaxID=1247963 RepID=UPI000690270C|nr:hypothetical protein [Parvularcula oceani]